MFGERTLFWVVIGICMLVGGCFIAAVAANLF